EDAFSTQMPVGRHPLAIVKLTVPPPELDANVHPTKREVRLLRERQIFGVVQRAVRHTLLGALGMPQLGDARGQLASRPPELAYLPDQAGFGLQIPSAGAPYIPADAYVPERPLLGRLRILG